MSDFLICKAWAATSTGDTQAEKELLKINGMVGRPSLFSYFKNSAVINGCVEMALAELRAERTAVAKVARQATTLRYNITSYNLYHPQISARRRHLFCWGTRKSGGIASIEVRKFCIVIPLLTWYGSWRINTLRATHQSAAR